MKKRFLKKLLLIFFGLSFLLMPISNALGFGFVPGPDPPPADTTPPTVAITSHSTGATISGAFTVRANANDNVGVTRVSFALGSFNLGYDNTAPYEKSYDIMNAGFSVNDGTHLLTAIAFDAAGNYAVNQVTVNVVGHSMRFAVIVGISDYKVGGDLSFCDEDATDWYNHLSGAQMDYDHIWVYGDSNASNYPKYDGKATEYNIQQALTNMVNMADDNDIIAFISSGHGSGDGIGSSYICAWDCDSGENGENGNFYDTELTAILENALAARIFVFLDHCRSGGFGSDLMNMGNNARVYCTTTCTEKGVGYGFPDKQNGFWTYYFLEFAWLLQYKSSATTSMETVFTFAFKAFPYTSPPFDGNFDKPQEFDGNTSALFYMA